MATREHVLAGLQSELRHAEANGASAYAARLRAQIARLSAGSPDNPARETTAARRPARSKS